MSFIFKNNATSRLKINTGLASTTVTVLAGEGVRFPQPVAPDTFPVTLEDRRTAQVEIMTCTARAGDILTVTRAQEGTAAQDFIAGATVSSRPTAGLWQSFQDQILNFGYSKAAADTKFVDAAGDTMTGPLSLSGAPTAPAHATSKSWVEALVGSVTSLSEAPIDGQPYVRQSAGWIIGVRKADYDANNVTITTNFTTVNNHLTTLDGQVSAIQTELTGVPHEAPTDGAIYGRMSSGWAATVTKADYDAFVTATNAQLGLKISDAPTDGAFYGRRNAGWGVVVGEAPNDSNVYVRGAAAWAIGILKSTYDAFVAATNTAIAGKVAKAGDTMTGTLVLAPAAASARLSVQAPAGAFSSIITLNKDVAATGANSIFSQVGGLARWTMYLGVNAEAAGNVGSDFFLQRFDNAGAFIDSPVTIPRSTGKMALSVVPTIPAPATGTDAANKTYVDAQVAAVVGGAIISDTAPGSPKVGQLWWESDTGNTFIWYADVNTSQWVQINVAPAAAPAFKGARVKINADKALVTAVPTNVIWDAVMEDVGGWWAAGAPTAFTVPAGVTRVRCLGCGGFVGNATGLRQVHIYKNGAPMAPTANNICAATASATQAIIDSGWLPVVAGDQFQLSLYQNIGSNLNMLASATWFAIEAYPGQ